MNNKCIMILIILLLNLFYCGISIADQISCSDSVEVVLKQTGFDFKDFQNIKSIERIKFYITIWNSNIDDKTSCLYFTNELEKNRIRNTKAVKIIFNFTNELSGNILIANFKAKRDAELALRDISSYSKGPDLNSLFSGEIPKNTIIQTRLFTNYAVIHIVYKNCVCQFILKSKEVKFSPENFEMIDDILKNINSVIDKSLF